MGQRSRSILHRFLNDCKQLSETLQTELERSSNPLNFSKSEPTTCIDTATIVHHFLRQITCIYLLQSDQLFKTSDSSPLSIQEILEITIATPLHFLKDVFEPLFYSKSLIQVEDTIIHPPFWLNVPVIDVIFQPIYDWQQVSLFLHNQHWLEIFDIFNNYHFSLKKSDSHYLTPEILGWLWESQLSLQNRKSKGIFYTPPEIANLITKQALVEYLRPIFSRSGLQTLEQGVLLQKLINQEFSEELEKFLSDYAVTIDRLLANLKFLDPAIGTGHFALEVAYLIPEIRNFLTPYLPEVSTRDLRELIHHTLINSIYGIDLDKEALQTARFSLLLTLPIDQLKPKEDLCLTLEKHLYFGNSLLEKPQDWPCQFDIILTNPPYVPITHISWDDRRQYEKIFRFATGRFNLFYLFLEKSESLTHLNSICGFLVPDRLFLNTQCQLLQNWLSQEKEILKIIPFKTSIFVGAIVDSIALLMRNRGSATKIEVFDNSKIPPLEVIKSEETRSIFLKIQSRSIALEKIATVKDGLIQGKVADQLFLKQPIDECSKKLLFGRDIDRYQIHFNQNWVNYRPEEMMCLEKQRRGEGVRHGLWLREAAIFERCKILTRQTADEIIAAYDSEGYYYANTLHGTTITDSRYSPLYMLAILNSSLLTWYYRMITTEMGKAFAQVKIKVLKQLPILRIDCADQQMIESLVTQIGERNRRGQPIEFCQERIDHLIYKWYGLTDEDILLIETMKFRKEQNNYR